MINNELKALWLVPIKDCADALGFDKAGNEKEFLQLSKFLITALQDCIIESIKPGIFLK